MIKKVIKISLWHKTNLCPSMKDFPDLFSTHSDRLDKNTEMFLASLVSSKECITEKKKLTTKADFPSYLNKKDFPEMFVCLILNLDPNPDSNGETIQTWIRICIILHADPKHWFQE